jgi:hypothetical protein
MTPPSGSARSGRPLQQRPRRRLTPSDRVQRIGTRRIILVVGAVAVTVVAAGCAATTGTPTAASAQGSSTAGGSGNPSVTDPGSGQGSGAAPGGSAAPGASGMIAAVQDGSFEVQSATSQTTVTYTADTAIQQSKAGDLADVTVGSCITAIAAPAASSGGSPAPGSTAVTPGGQRLGRSTPASITAASVSIQPEANGSCAAAGLGGFAGFTGGRSGAPGAQRTFTGGARPTGAPSTSGSGGRGGIGSGFAAFGGVVFGQVTSVSGSTITVAATEFAGRAGRGAGASGTGTAESPRPTTSASAPPAAGVTSTVTVTSATAYTDSAAAQPSAITVGLCASAFGTADDTGAIAATDIRLSDPVDGSCQAGFGSGRGGFGGFPRSGGSGSDSAPVTTHG